MKRALFIAATMTIVVASAFSEIKPPLDLVGSWHYRVLIGVKAELGGDETETWRVDGYLAPDEYADYYVPVNLGTRQQASTRKGLESQPYTFLPNGFGSLGERPLIWEWESSAHLVIVLRDSKKRYTFSSVNENVWIVFIEDLANQSRDRHFDIGVFERKK